VGSETLRHFGAERMKEGTPDRVGVRGGENLQ
jgi:hypothetical protein